jgi:hypothetical protein
MFTFTLLSKEAGLEVNAEITVYVAVSSPKCIKIANISFEKVEQFIYLGMTARNQNSI